MSYTQWQPRSDTAANWVSTNPTLLNGEIGYETDTGAKKTGTGSTAWTSLAYDNWCYWLSADRGTVGSTIADYFSGGGVTLAASGVYELDWDISFLKSTAGTLTFTLTSSAAPQNVVAKWTGSVITGISATGATSQAGVVTQSSTGIALPVTGSLSNTANHQYNIKAVVQANAAGQTIRLQVTSSAGTITPLKGSIFRLNRISSNTHGFA